MKTKSVYRNAGFQVCSVAGFQTCGRLNAGDLPVDARELIALCAPRPTFISPGAAEGSGAEGKWVDQRGSFMDAAAGPVFRLLGRRGLRTTEFPAVGTALVADELAWRQHSSGHDRPKLADVPRMGGSPHQIPRRQQTLAEITIVSCMETQAT